MTCQYCGRNPAAGAIGICVNCVRTLADVSVLTDLHAEIRKKFELPAQPPHHEPGITCNFCSNNCQIGPGASGYCGLRRNENGRRVDHAPKGCGLAYMYLDPLPTNCCAAWFCKGSTWSGYNLAVFFYGCNFDCLFCQNSSHKFLQQASILTEAELVQAALDSQVRCICFFGGSPEPQLPFALSVAEKIARGSNYQKPICWEWNGCGNAKLVKKAAELAAITGGTVKFDLKSDHPNVSLALCGIDNRVAMENFYRVGKLLPRSNLLTATTLLVPFYIDEVEVENIARYIADINRDLPYSLLIFMPDFYLADLPITPRQQVDECYHIAKKYLNRVNLGNKHLLNRN